MKVRLKGWQMHWPREDREIKSIDLDRTEAVLDRPLVGRSVWSLDDLATPHK